MKQAMQLLKVDERGRVRTPRERREMLVEEFERSGTSAASFAKLAGVCYSTFAGWVHRRRKQRASQEQRSVGEATVMPWVEVAVAEETVDPSGSLWVHLPGGASVQIGNSMQVQLAAQLLRAMGIEGGRAIC